MSYGVGISTDVKEKAPFGKGSLLYLVPLGVEINPRLNRGKIKSFSKRKPPSIIVVCLATHYVKYKEDFQKWKIK